MQPSQEEVRHARANRRNQPARAGRAVAVALLVCAGAAYVVPHGSYSQPAPSAASAQSGEAQTKAVPFGPGEVLEYNVSLGPLRLASGSMTVAPMDTIRGRTAFHVVFRVAGGPFFYKVNDTLESWFDAESLVSLRYRQRNQEKGKIRAHTWEIFPERQTYRESNDTVEKPSVEQPLDDASFLYFVRTVPLAADSEYHFARYFKPESNPVRVRVLRRERVKVPAGTFDAVVVQPIIKTKGIFSEGGRAEIWFSDDERRLMVQMKSKLPFGSLNMYLRSYTPPVDRRPKP